MATNFAANQLTLPNSTPIRYQITANNNRKERVVEGGNFKHRKKLK